MRALREAMHQQQLGAGSNGGGGPLGVPGPSGGPSADVLGASLRDGSLLTALARLATPGGGRAAAGSQVRRRIEHVQVSFHHASEEGFKSFGFVMSHGSSPRLPHPDFSLQIMVW